MDTTCTIQDSIHVFSLVHINMCPGFWVHIKLLPAFLIGFILDSFLHSAPAACGTVKGKCHTVFGKSG